MKTPILLAAAIFAATTATHAVEILNASYDVTREFYSDYNTLFARHWKEKTGREIAINQSHGGSSKQARAILDGLDADVATMNQETDIDILSRAGLLPADWRTLLPDNSAPYTTAVVFLVRKGNPKNIRDWGDLARDGVSVAVPNPKTSGNGRYGYLSAWAWAAREFQNDETRIRGFISRLFKNVPVLDTGGRAATTTFTQKGIGDVLVTFESETLQIARVIDPGNFEVVHPTLSIAADAPAAVVSKNTERRGTTAAATEYLAHLWSPEAQSLAAKHFFRPRLPQKVDSMNQLFPEIELIPVDQAHGSWDQAQMIHFDDGGTFDQVYATTP
jgi:sulfate transport system substrate-binding protein